MSDPKFYGKESHRTLLLIFVLSGVVSMGLGYALVPESVSTWKAVLGSGILGAHGAMYPFVNRLLLMD